MMPSAAAVALPAQRRELWIDSRELAIVSVLPAPAALAPELKFVVVAPVAVPAIFVVGYALTRDPGLSRVL